MKILRFGAPPWTLELRKNVRYSYWAHWKARSGVFISVLQMKTVGSTFY